MLIEIAFRITNPPSQFFLDDVSLEDLGIPQFDARWVEVANSYYNPKLNPAVLYDETGQRLVMIGGGYNIFENGAFTPYFSNDILQWKSGMWTRLSSVNTPLEKIRPRADHSASFDPVRNEIIISAGAASYAYEDTWSLSGTALNLVTASFPTFNDGKGGSFLMMSQIDPL